MGKSKSLDTEDPPSSPGDSRLLTEPVTSITKDCHDHARAESCDNCTDNDKVRDLELNKVTFLIKKCGYKLLNRD